MLELPATERAHLSEINLDLHISGTGDGASGIINLDTNEIEILAGGKAFPKSLPCRLWMTKITPC